MSARYLMTIHLIGGQRLEVPCVEYPEIVAQADHHGAPLPPTISVVQSDEQQPRLAYLHFGAVAAIEVEERPDEDD